jgi:hypothetical protein
MYLYLESFQNSLAVNALIVFIRSKTAIVSSNPIRGLEVRVYAILVNNWPYGRQIISPKNPTDCPYKIQILEAINSELA